VLVNQYALIDILTNDQFTAGFVFQIDLACPNIPYALSEDYLNHVGSNFTQTFNYLILELLLCDILRHFETCSEEGSIGVCFI
jgi:hypothetical protein